MFGIRLWLLYVQGLVMHAFCRHCLFSAALIFLLTGIAVINPAFGLNTGTDFPFEHLLRWGSAKFDACMLIKKEEIQAIQGSPIADTKKGDPRDANILL